MKRVFVVIVKEGCRWVPVAVYEVEVTARAFAKSYYPDEVDVI